MIIIILKIEKIISFLNYNKTKNIILILNIFYIKLNLTNKIKLNKYLK